MAFTRKCFLLLSSLLACGVLPVSADLLYDNSSNDLKIRFNPGTVEVGDEITLAAPGFLTNFSFEYYGLHDGSATTPFAGAFEANVRFYNMDGPTFNGFPSPGTVFWQSIFGVPGPTERNTFVFNTDLPANMLLPQNFTWSVQFSHLGTATGDEIGLDLYNPVTVGSSAWDYWRKTDGTWVLAQTDPVQPINFASRFEGTVPEPSITSLLILGGLAAFVSRQRRRS